MLGYPARCTLSYPRKAPIMTNIGYWLAAAFMVAILMLFFWNIYEIIIHANYMRENGLYIFGRIQS